MGVSLTERGVSRSVVFATPRIGEGEDFSDWAPAVTQADTAVLYMAAGQAAEIAGILEAQGMPISTPVVLVENASLPGSRHIGCTLRGLKNGAAQGLAGPALLLFGDVFRKRARALIAQELMAGDTPLQATPPLRTTLEIVVN